MKLTRSKRNTPTAELPSNYKLGKNVEEETCNMLSAYGFFAYNTKNGVGGQPCDIIAMHGHLNLLLDAKHIEKGTRFDLRNIQDNQHDCFVGAQIYNGIDNCGFVIYCQETNTYYYLPYSLVLTIERANVERSINVNQLQLFNSKLNEWRKEYEDYDRCRDNDRRTN